MINEMIDERPDSPMNQNDGRKKQYKEVINKAMIQKADKAEVSAKLREMFPEVANNSVEVNWSPDGKKVEVYNNKSYTKNLNQYQRKR